MKVGKEAKDAVTGIREKATNEGQGMKVHQWQMKGAWKEKREDRSTVR